MVLGQSRERVSHHIVMFNKNLEQPRPPGIQAGGAPPVRPRSSSSRR